MMKRHVIALLVAGAMLLGGAPAAADQELIVSAAASLTNAMKEVSAQFEKTHPGAKILCNFAASGSLLQQMAKGAPVDVFAAADQKTMNQAQEKKLIVPDTRKNFVSNRLVLIVPMDSTLTLSGLKDLTRPEVKRIGVGNPATVPAGRYAKQALEKAGLVGPIVTPVHSGRVGAPGVGLCQAGRGGRGPGLLHRRGYRQGESQGRSDGDRTCPHPLSHCGDRLHG